MQPVRVGAGVVGLSAVAAFGQPSGFETPASCRTAVAENLGVPFYRVCPSEPGGRSFWIGAPLTCNRGEHETVQCPHATALVHPGVLPMTALPASEVAMVEGFTAQRLCGLRFAGRLPTRAERETARDAIGIAALLASASPGESFEIALSEMPEWLADGVCDSPSVLGPDCRLATYPTAPVPLPLAWEALSTCDAAPVELDDAAQACELGATCRVRAPLWETALSLGGERGSPALLVSPGKARAGYALRCDIPRPGIHAAPVEAVAAVRCVLGDTALTGTPRTEDTGPAPGGH
jgi:hypothetical protein